MKKKYLKLYRAAGMRVYEFNCATVYTIREAALIFKKDLDWMRGRLEEGTLHGRKINNTWLVSGQAIREYIEDR